MKKVPTTQEKVQPTLEELRKSFLHHLYVARDAEGKMGRSRLKAGHALLQLRQRVETGDPEANGLPWWQYYREYLGGHLRSRRDAEKIMALAKADDPEAAEEQARAKNTEQHRRARKNKKSAADIRRDRGANEDEAATGHHIATADGSTGIASVIPTTNRGAILSKIPDPAPDIAALAAVNSTGGLSQCELEDREVDLARAAYVRALAAFTEQDKRQELARFVKALGLGTIDLINVCGEIKKMTHSNNRARSMSNNKGRALLDGDVVRRISESNLPALPAGKAQLGFKVARPLSIRRSRSSKGSAVRRCAQGRCAAMTKPMAQVVGEAKREDDGPELLHARQLLDDGVSLERAWRELNDERSHATPQVTIESIMYCVRQRGLAALKEPANLERLPRCDAAAKAQIDRRIEKLIAAKEIGHD